MTLRAILVAQGNLKRRGMAQKANASPFSLPPHSSELRALIYWRMPGFLNLQDSGVCASDDCFLSKPNSCDYWRAPMDNEQLEFFATCPQGFEHILADELKRLRARSVRPLKGGVAFFGGKVEGYRVCLWSHVASRVLRVMGRVDAGNAESLYRGVKELPWAAVVGEGATIAVTARGGNDALRNTQFTGLKVKDAVCDCLRDARGKRPDVQPQRPDVPIWVSLHGKKATVSIDYAGESLHRRGYRVPGENVEAPLKEALAAGMLVWGGWDHLAAPALRRAQAQREGADGVAEAPVFVDPACGSGTLVLEAAMMATDRAPGLARDYWGFEGCADFDADAFDDLLADADERFERGLEGAPKLFGFDVDSQAVGIARGNARRLGLSRLVTFGCADCENLEGSLQQNGVGLEQRGFIALNPPYGVRLLTHGLEGFYSHLAKGLRNLPDSWDMTVITPDADFDASVGFDAQRTLPVFNGAIEATLRSYRLGHTSIIEAPLVTLEGVEVKVGVFSDHALQFAARLRKMAKARRKWAKKSDIHAYRIYDADLPDYAVAVDLFEEAGSAKVNLLITEYQAPKEIDPHKAMLRFKDACAVAPVLLGVPEDRVFTRVRRQAKGGSQYRKQEHVSHRIMVEEAGHAFELDLSGYLDTGLFLDHRTTRAMVGGIAADKRFLNLFAYTGTASVYAAVGGAVSTTTVDMSQTYLDWAKRNMKNAGFAGSAHRFVRADVLSWIEQAADAEAESYDLVFVDPPTFSNSKAMGERTWDIQRDHGELLRLVRRMLAPGGRIVFSGNLRSFKLDELKVRSCGLGIEDVTAQTIPEDFSRNPKIHFCYVLSDLRG